MIGPAFRTCGVRIDALSLAQAADTIVAAARDRRPLATHLCNAYTLSLCVRDPDLARVVDAGDLNLMDGAPLVWTARRLGFTHCTERVYGPDLMLEVMDRGRAHGLRHHLYGGRPEVVAALEARLTSRLPGLEVVARESPPFRDLTEAEQQAAVTHLRAVGADVVWVGLGTPRQDVAVQRLREVGVPLVAVGAAFDFHAGVKRQAPGWMRRAGLEWLFRLLTEPRRLWRRYLVGNPVFLYGLARGVERVGPSPRDP